jgi:hypothetical protein
MTDFGKSAKGPTLTDLTSVASNATNINAVATNMQDVQDVATEINASPSLRNLMDSVLNDTVSLDGLTDTNLGTLTSSEDGYSLNYDHASTKWVPTAVSSGSNVTQLSDLDVTDPITDGDGLKWNGSLNSGSGGYEAASFAEIGADIPSPTVSGGFLRANGAGTQFEMSQPVANLSSTSNTDVLAASQGKALADQIAGLPDPIVVSDNTARDALTNLSVGDIVHVQSDSTVGSNGWRRWQVTAVNTTTNTWANATKIDLASQDDLRGSIIVSADANNSVSASGNDGGAFLDLSSQNIAFTNAAADFGANQVASQDFLANGDGSAAAGAIQYNCWNNNHYVILEGPVHDASGDNTVLRLPRTAPASVGQVLSVKAAPSVDGQTGVTTAELEFSTPSTGASTGFAIAMSIVF